MWQWKSLRTKLFYTYAAIIMVILFSFAVGISYLIRGHMYENKNKELQKHALEIANSIVALSANNDINSMRVQEYLADIDVLLNVRLLVIDSKQELVYLSPHSIDYGEKNIINQEREIYRQYKARTNEERRKFAAERLGEKDSTFKKIIAPVYEGQIISREFLHPVYNEEVLFLCAPIMLGEEIIGVLVISSAVGGIQGFLQEVHVYIAQIMLLALLLSFILVHWFSKESIAPLVKMQQSAAAMAAGDYSLHIEVKGRDEVANLGRSLNRLGEDLEKFVDSMNTQEKIRRDFVANVSHELRTPLTIIRGYNDAIADGTVQDPQKIAFYQAIITDEVSRLERLIKDLLEISRLQSGREIVNENIPLMELVSQVLAKLQLQAQGKKIELVADLEEAVIIGNGDRLVQMLIILVDNAIKYTPAGGKVEVLLKKLEEYVSLTVADTGRGIPPEDLDYIWERFYKVDKSHSRKEEGTGLGLAIAREIMNLHRANVSIDSQLGKGTCIKIDFPYDVNKYKK